MSEPKWTPGPWQPHRSTGYGWNVVRPDGDAELGNWMMAERIRREEDARLIAAAPDLYAALEEYVRDYGDNEDSDSQIMAEKARVALAKARGET